MRTLMHFLIDTSRKILYGRKYQFKNRTLSIERAWVVGRLRFEVSGWYQRSQK